jgi:glycerophosphoryl diester phosphodiesterase
MPAFARALELGVDAIETDVHLSADGEVVVSHDATGRRMTGIDRAIASTTLPELRRWDAGWGFVDAAGRRPFAGQGIVVPTLHELCDIAGEVRLNIDIKQRHPSMVAPLLALLRDRGVEARVTLASFAPRTMREVRARGFRGEAALTREQIVSLALLPARARRALGAVAGDAVQIPIRMGPLDLTSRRLIDRCHALGLRVDYWTLDDPAVAAVLLDRGADGVMSNDPAALAPVFARERAWRSGGV